MLDFIVMQMSKGNRERAITCNWGTGRENARVQVAFGFGFAFIIGWKSGVSFVGQSQNAMQNQSERNLLENRSVTMLLSARGHSRLKVRLWKLNILQQCFEDYD